MISIVTVPVELEALTGYTTTEFSVNAEYTSNTNPVLVPDPEVAVDKAAGIPVFAEVPPVLADT